MKNFFRSIREVLSHSGADGFGKEVERFKEYYEGRKGEEYEVVEEGKKSWEVVDKARGKGSMREKVVELSEVVEEEKEKVLVGAVVEEAIRLKE
jgi:predicted type IV restriction endonuclease